MRIHSDILTRQNFINAAYAAGVSVIDLSEHGSHSRLRAFTWTLSGSGRNGGQWGTQDHKAATWDEWGIFFSHLFEVDPLAHNGKWPYLSGEHFHWSTGGRFHELRPSEQHKRHKWNRQGLGATGSYAIAVCSCGALQRWMVYGHEFAELAS